MATTKQLKNGKEIGLLPRRGFNLDSAILGERLHSFLSRTLQIEQEAFSQGELDVGWITWLGWVQMRYCI